MIAPAVILVRTAGPVNLGLVGRACANLGVTDLRLVQPITEIDVADVRRFANHAKDLVLGAPVFDEMAAAVADLDWVVATSAATRNRKTLPTSGPEGVAEAFAQTNPACWGVVFGNETNGLSNDELAYCQHSVQLPTPGSYPSYNLSHAVVVTLYEVLRQPVTPLELDGPAPREVLEQFSQFVTDTLERTGFFKRVEPHRFMPKLRRTFDRFGMSRSDINLLWGILAHLSGRRDVDSTTLLADRDSREEPPR